MTYTFPCTDCGVVTPTKLRKPKRCAPCAKAEALDYSRWNYRAHRDELLAYHRERYARNRESILAQRAAGGGRGGRRDEGRSRAATRPRAGARSVAVRTPAARRQPQRAAGALDR